MNLILKISIVLLVGILGGKVAKRFNLPNVSGYLVAGLFIGSSFLNLITDQDIQSFSIVNEIALAAIAFSIGSEFLLKDLLKVGKNIVIITVAEVIGAIGVVFLVTYFIFNQSFPFSIVIASMSAATAPAATIMVMRQYNSDGPLTRTILPVVALDDALGIIAFSMALSIAKISMGAVDFSFFSVILKPLIEVFGSLLLGFIIGVILTYLSNRAKNKEELLALVLTSIGAATGIANAIALSPLLTCMMLGATLVNLMHNSKRVFSTINDFTSPIYLMFFTLAGASLNLKILMEVGTLGLGYIIARAAGKIIGASLGAKAVNADDAVVKYLGLGLLPQGGISIGLSMIVKQQLPELSTAIITIIMFSVLVYEVSGPIFAKIAIDKAGEIDGRIKKTN